MVAVRSLPITSTTMAAATFAKSIESVSYTHLDVYKRQGIHMNEIQLGLLLMAYGLVGTFVALALFFLIIKLLGKIFPEKNK